MHINIEVTQEDLDKGVRDDPRYCPVALAFKRKGYLVEVGNTFFVYYNQFITMPSDIREFVSKIDKEQPVSPANFTVEF